MLSSLRKFQYMARRFLQIETTTCVDVDLLVQDRFLLSVAGATKRQRRQMNPHTTKGRGEKKGTNDV